MPAIGTLIMMNLDSNDPKGLTEFYATVLDWKVVVAENDYGMLTSESGTSIGFGRIDNYEAAPWPDPEGVKRYHLDMYVADPQQAKLDLVKLGATVADPQPDPDKWTVMLDPQGHPFCIVKSKD